MKKAMRKFFEYNVENFSKVLEQNNPVITFAVLVNLREVLDSYIEASFNEMQKANKQTNKKRKEGKTNE